MSATSRPRAAAPAVLGERQDAVDQRGVEHLAALLGHQRVEARVLAVGQPAAVVEAADDLLLDLAEQRDELGDAGEVVGSRGRVSTAAWWRGSEYVSAAGS